MSSTEIPGPTYNGRKRGRTQRTCPECGQNFTKAEHLERHIRTHTREKPFRCNLCGKSYSRHDSLLRHDRTHQSGKRKRSINVADRTTSPESGSETMNDQEASIHSLVCDPSTSGSFLPAHAQVEPGTHQHRSEPVDPSFNSQYMATQSNGRPLHYSHDQLNLGELQGLPGSIFNTPTDLDFRDLGIDFQEPSWLPASFDVTAMNDSISTTIFEWGNLNSGIYDICGYGNAPDNLAGSKTPSGPISNIQTNWHTIVSRPDTPDDETSTAPTSQQDRVDDQYREGLSNRLRPGVSDPSLPSADFLNLCIKLYFTKFNPVFPLIHAPSFRPSSDNTLHLLSICSIGALFVGSASAAVQGRKIFVTLHKAIVASAGNYLGKGSREVLSLAQAATIGQTFGMLTGRPSDLLMTESYHGSIIAWARHGGFFKCKGSLTAVENDSTTSLQEQWRKWVYAEESIRLVAGLRIHDAEFSIAFQHEPLLRHTIGSIPPCCSDDIFFATTADQWRVFVDNVQRHQPYAGLDMSTSQGYHNRSRIVSYAALAGLLASIQEMRCSNLDSSSIEHFRTSLLTWHKGYAHDFRDVGYDPTNLMVLWHESFMALYADFDQLEKVLGRDGEAAARTARGTMSVWANSSEARRGVLHALLVVKHMEALPVGAEIAIHVPRALFYSAVIIFCYIKSAATVNLNIPPSQEEIDIPEMQVSEPTRASSTPNERSSSAKFGSIDPSLLCHITDLLRRVGHWEVSRRYASILESLLDDFAKQ